jgi:hypothetical protein
MYACVLSASLPFSVFRATNVVCTVPITVSFVSRGIKVPVLAQEAASPIVIAAKTNGHFRKMFIKPPYITYIPPLL